LSKKINLFEDLQTGFLPKWVANGCTCLRLILCYLLGD